MPEIKILPQSLANKIAAGEVVERPVSVVKELVENALDAGATRIIVEISKGGVEQISVSDNGSGIPRNAVTTVFLRHATSKLATEDDLYKISTMGFRGEALSSISAVAEITLITRTDNEQIGTQLVFAPTQEPRIADVGCNVGTTLVVNRLFANVPARMKFLKRDATETAYITDVLGKIALSNPAIYFKYMTDGDTIFTTSGDGNLRNAIFEIYGKECAKALVDMDYTADGIRIFGVLGTAEIARGNRARQTIFVNGRYIKNYILAKVVEDAYKTLLSVGKFPFFVLNIEVPFELVDVNVHPAKTEVKFADERYVCRELYHAAKRALDGANAVTAEKIACSPKSQNLVGAVIGRPQNETIPQITQISLQQPQTLELLRVADSATEKEDYDTKYDKFAVGAGSSHPQNLEIPSLQTTNSLQTGEHGSPLQNLQLPQPQEIERIIIGQIFDTYLLIEEDGKLCIIDQHAAHERINYERIMTQFRARETIEGQILLTPEVVRFTAVEKSGILENLEVFASIGFALEDFGASDMIIRETPVPQSVEAIKENVLEVLKLLERHKTVDLSDIREKMLHQMACKSSVRAGRKLNEEETTELLIQLDLLGETNTCPHGRPIRISITKFELEKMFLRG